MNGQVLFSIVTLHLCKEYVTAVKFTDLAWNTSRKSFVCNTSDTVDSPYTVSSASLLFVTSAIQAGDVVRPACIPT